MSLELYGFEAFFINNGSVRVLQFSGDTPKEERQF
jgi:hypothetical protein